MDSKKKEKWLQKRNSGERRKEEIGQKKEQI